MTHPHIITIEGGNKLLASLSPLDEWHTIEMSLSRIRLTAGATIFDGEMDRVLFIESGLILPMVITGTGESLGVAIIGSEGAVGLFEDGDGEYSFQFRAMTDVEALQINARTLSLACSRNEQLETLLRTYSQRLMKNAILVMACHYHHGLEKRLPRWLLTTAARIGSNTLFTTQNVLADAHGVTISAISHTLEDLQRKGLIQHERGQITLLNHKGLRSLACQCCPTTGQGKKYVIRTHSL